MESQDGKPAIWEIFSEARLAVAFLNGVTVSKYAKDKGTSENAGRTRLKQIMQKCGLG